MKRTYSKEFKIKACELVIKDNIAVAVVAEKIRHTPRDVTPVGKRIP